MSQQAKSPSRSDGFIVIAGVKIRFHAKSTDRGLDRYSAFMSHKNAGAARRSAIVYGGNPYAFENDLRKIVAVELARRGGFLLHASGASPLNKSDGRRRSATVFCGRSGSGKSTIVAEFPPCDVLSDELVAIARRGDGYVACATPFRGMLSEPGPAFEAPLGRVFFLKQSARLAVKPSPERLTFRRIIRNILLPKPSDTGEAAKLMFKNAADFASRVECRELRFAREDIGAIRKMAER